MLEAVVLVKPGHGFQVAVFTRRLRGAGGRLVGGTPLGTGLGRAGEPLDAILRSLVPAGAVNRHFRRVRWRGLYPFGLIWKYLGRSMAAAVGVSHARYCKTQSRAYNNQLGLFHDEFLWTGIRLAYCFALMGSRLQATFK